jgi:PAS domain S-box-containing protein
LLIDDRVLNAGGIVQNSASLRSLMDYLFIIGTTILFFLLLRRVLLTRERSADALAAERNLLRTLIDNMPDYVFIKDRQSRFIVANKAQRRQYGLQTEEQIVGRTDFDFHPHELAKRYFEDEQAVMAFNQPLSNHAEPTLDESKNLIWVSTTKVPLRDKHGVITGLVGIVHDITQAKLADHALYMAHQQLEQRVEERTAALSAANDTLKQQIEERTRLEAELRAVLAAMSDLILVLDGQGRYLRAMPTHSPVSSRAAQELIGKSVKDIFPAKLAETFEGHICRALQTGLTVNAEYSTLGGDGIEHWFTAAISPMDSDRVVWVARDVTEHHQAEEEIRRREELYRTLIRNFPNGAVALFDSDLRITLAEGTALQSVGYVGEPVNGKTLHEAFPQVSNLLESHMRATFEGKVASLELTFGEATFQIQLVPVKNERGEIFAGMAVGQDISERNRMEVDLRRAHDELEIRVVARTAEPSESNTMLQQEIAERRRVEEAEREQRVLAEALRDSAAALNSTLNFEEVLDRILDNVNRVIAYSVGNVMLIESGVARVVRRRGYDELGLSDAVMAVRFPIAETPNLRQIMETRRPLIVPDVREYPGWIELPEFRWLRSSVGTPICVDDGVIGFLNLDSAIPGAYTPAHAERLQAFADQLAIAIRNAHMYGQAQALAAMQERQRLARELHDAVSQTLFSASVVAGSLPLLFERRPDKVRSGLAQLEQLTRGALAEMRTLLLELRPAGLVEADLGDLLKQLGVAITSRTDVPIDLTVEGSQPLPADVQITFYRIAQEALNNIVKHARASCVKVDLNRNSETVTLQVEDNGRGFDPQHAQPGRLGIEIMRERAQSIGATFSLDSQAGQGTHITITWPIQESNHE